MRKPFVLLSSLLTVVATTAACGVERTSTVLGPTSTSTLSATLGTSSTASLLGTWVIQGTTRTASVTTAALSTVPDFSNCGNFRWELTTQTATQVSGNFTADCVGGVTISGVIAGQLGAATIPIVMTGALARGSDSCSFPLTGTGTPIDSVTFAITYSGTTCLGPMQGTNTLSLAPHSAPTAFTVSGTITDGTSGGILPGIEVSAPGVAVRSDGAGHYQLPAVPAAVTVQFAAAG